MASSSNTVGGSSPSASAAAAKSTAIGNVLWSKQPKANAELFALTYGALIGELLRDLEKPELISAELDRMGHSMGIRSIEEFLAQIGMASSETPVPVASTFQGTPETLRMALRMFYGIHATTIMTTGTPGASATTPGEAATAADGSSSNNKSTYSLFFTENPLTLFVELPEDIASDGSSSFEYNQLLAGWCRGVLELLQFDCTCRIKQSMLAGDNINEIEIQLNQILQQGAGEDYQEE